MSDDTEFFSQRDRMAFRRFALNRLKSGTFDLGDGAELARQLDLQDRPDEVGNNVLDLSLMSLRQYFAHAYRNRRPDGSRFRVYPAFVNGRIPNAFAWEFRQVHLCGVYLGLASVCHEFSLFCLAQQTTFPDIGDPSVETSPESIDGFPPGFWLYQAGTDLDEAEQIARWSSLQPRDHHRKQAVEYLTILMLRFVWLHELCHGLNGHVGLAKSHGWVPYLHENGVEPSRGIAKRQIQCLEFDADQSALYMLCRIQTDGLENIPGLCDWSLPERLALSIFAAYATTWILDEYARGPDAPEETDHPDPYQRLHNLIWTLASNVAPIVPDLKPIHMACLGEVGRVAQVIPSFLKPDMIIHDLRAKTLEAELSGFQEDLSRLRGDLVPYRYTQRQKS
ncbi:MAG: hypothetical protein H6907_09990 [Hyphomicrobiales bacterium]|nr:hypothetical protein [Hyphomicrobiales bacterium]MCP5372049.1 hypothetical protein [Hyphomicrobiales bacterium]